MNDGYSGEIEINIFCQACGKILKRWGVIALKGIVKITANSSGVITGECACKERIVK